MKSILFPIIDIYLYHGTILPMKVLFFCQRYYPAVGGVEKHVRKLSAELRKKGYEIEIITEQIEKSSKKIEGKTIDGVSVYYLNLGKPSKLKKFRIWWILWKFRSHIQSADIIHCHDVFIWYLPFRFLFPLKKVFITFHGYESYPIPKKNILIHQFSEKLSYGNISIGAFIPKWYGTHATRISYGATKTKKIKDVRSKITEKNSAVFIGRLDEQTGITTYVAAIKILKKKYPKFEFITVGDGEYRNFIEKKVTVLGWQENPEKYFQRYRFAFVSRYLSIFEAFAAKRLVFAVYNNPIKKDYLAMTPFKDFIFVSKNEKELANQVLSILKNPKKEREMVENAWKWVQSQTWEHMAQLYISLWNGSKHK